MRPVSKVILILSPECDYAFLFIKIPLLLTVILGLTTIHNENNLMEC